LTSESNAGGSAQLLGLGVKNLGNPAAMLLPPARVEELIEAASPLIESPSSVHPGAEYHERVLGDAVRFVDLEDPGQGFVACLWH